MMRYLSMSLRRRWFAIVVLASLAAAAPAADEGTKSDPSGGSAPITDERGFTSLGTVRFHPRDKIIEADGTLNMNRGFVEFLACAPGTLAHETLVALECNPVDLKAALLLLGLDDARDPKIGEGLAAVPGPRVMILLRWEGPPTPEERERAAADPTQQLDDLPRTHEHRVEDLLVNGYTEDDMERCGFAYTGSRFISEREITFDPWESPPESGDEGGEDTPDTRPAGAGEGARAAEPELVFAPLATKEYITVGHRSLTLLSNPLELYEVDGNYYAYWARLPSMKSDDPVPVTMIFRLPKEGEIDYTIQRMKTPPEPDPGTKPVPDDPPKVK